MSTCWEDERKRREGGGGDEGGQQVREGWPWLWRQDNLSSVSSPTATVCQGKRKQDQTRRLKLTQPFEEALSKNVPTRVTAHIPEEAKSKRRFVIQTNR